jgi:Uncharacterized conserved protein
MKRIIYSTILLVCLSAIDISAQEQKLRFYIESSYLFGLVEKGDGFKINRSDSKMNGLSLHLSALYSLSKVISIGGGLGLDRYNNPGYNTLPFFLSMHCMPISMNRNIYAFTNIGYGIGGGDFTKGKMCDLGIGYKLIIKQSFGLNFKLGYNLKSINSEVKDFWGTTNLGTIDRDRHSIFIAFGAIL